jgi:hypothetical protein
MCRKQLNIAGLTLSHLAESYILPQELLCSIVSLTVDLTDLGEAHSLQQNAHAAFNQMYPV